MHLQVKSKLGEEKKLFPFMADWFRGAKIDEEDYQDLLTAVTEACLNAIEHGNGLDPRLPVDVELTSDDREVVIRVKDHGQGISNLEPSSLEAAGLESELEARRGWGLKFIQAFVDELNFYHEMTSPPRFCMEMKKKLWKNGWRS